ncbi:LanC-like protein 2 [Mactra antiquata]
MAERNDDRCYINKYDAYSSNVANMVGQDGKLNEALGKSIQKHIDLLLERLYQGLSEDEENNYIVYTGIGGIAFLHLHLYEKLKQDRGQLECALDCLRRPLKHLNGRKLSFLCGDAGPLALAAVTYHKLGNKAGSSDCIKRLVSLYKDVIQDPSLPDELLNGRVGYLYALLYVNTMIKPDTIDRDIILKVYKCVIDSGIHMSQQQGWRHPLMYAWHDKHYLGAAHGIAGIFYILMQVNDDSVKKYLEELIRPSIEYMLTLQYPSGNGPSSIGSSSRDKLIHWCHGAPGWIHMFIMAYKIFGEDRYLQAAKSCSNVIWNRGLLKKGYGICHGIAGNGYAFLAMYKLTGEEQYLYQACKFAEFMMDKHRKPRIADRPYSLFEGVAGTIYFLIDLLDPKNAKFPAFDI